MKDGYYYVHYENFTEPEKKVQDSLAKPLFKLLEEDIIEAEEINN